MATSFFGGAFFGGEFFNVPAAVTAGGAARYYAADYTDYRKAELKREILAITRKRKKIERISSASTGEETTIKAAVESRLPIPSESMMTIKIWHIRCPM